MVQGNNGEGGGEVHHRNLLGNVWDGVPKQKQQRVKKDTGGGNWSKKKGRAAPGIQPDSPYKRGVLLYPFPEVSRLQPVHPILQRSGKKKKGTPHQPGRN